MKQHQISLKSISMVILVFSSASAQHLSKNAPLLMTSGDKDEDSSHQGEHRRLKMMRAQRIFGRDKIDFWLPREGKKALIGQPNKVYELLLKQMDDNALDPIEMSTTWLIVLNSKGRRISAMDADKIRDALYAQPRPAYYGGPTDNMDNGGPKESMDNGDHDDNMDGSDHNDNKDGSDHNDNKDGSDHNDNKDCSDDDDNKDDGDDHHYEDSESADYAMDPKYAKDSEYHHHHINLSNLLKEYLYDKNLPVMKYDDSKVASGDESPIASDYSDSGKEKSMLPTADGSSDCDGDVHQTPTANESSDCDHDSRTDIEKMSLDKTITDTDCNQDDQVLSQIPAADGSLPASYGQEPSAAGYDQIFSQMSEPAYQNMPANNMPVNNMPVNNMPENNMPVNNMPVNNMPVNNMLNSDPVQDLGGYDTMASKPMPTHAHC